MISRPRLFVYCAMGLVLTGVTAACGDDPFKITWFDTPDTTIVYSMARPELDLPSAFDFRDRARFVIESAGSTNNWDVAVDTRDERLSLIPPGAIGIINEARLTVIEGVSYEEVTRAPEDTTLYTATEAIPLELGNVYVVRTRRQSSPFGFCVFYAKLEPLALDSELESVRFVHDHNPVCDDRNLQPDQDRPS